MRLPLALIAAVSVMGCQGGATPGATGVNPTPPAARVDPPRPRSMTPTPIALVRRNQAVTVGMSADDAFRVFRDAREGGFEDERLPPGFAAPYRARSWEAGPRGFGVLTYPVAGQDRVVAAMYQEERASYERALELVRVHEERMGRPVDTPIAGKRLNYWFWEQDDQRLMILAFQTGGSEGVKITVAMGDVAVLDALGVSPERANKEIPAVDRQLSIEDSRKNSEPVRKG